MPVNCIFADFEGDNYNTLTLLKPLLQSRINTDFLTFAFSTITEDNDYDK